MTKYREILRLKSLGFSERNIAHSCGVSRNTVAKVVKKAAGINLSWPLDHDMTDSTLEEMLFPKTKSATNKRMPDYDYIRRELLRNGVNKKLLLRTHQTPFNSRPHTEVDLFLLCQARQSLYFQFTTSHGGRHGQEIIVNGNDELSIHDLTRRSTKSDADLEEQIALSIHDLTRRST